MAVEVPKLNVDATKAIVFCVVFIGVCALIATGKLSAEYLKFLLAWLIPGPMTFEPAAPAAPAKEPLPAPGQLALPAVPPAPTEKS